MNKKISIIVMAAALASAFCLSACGGDKNKPTTAATTAAATTAAQSQDTQATTSEESKSNDQGSANGGIPNEGDMYKGKKVASVEKIPDCDDDKHGVYYIYDEAGEIIDTIKY